MSLLKNNILHGNYGNEVVHRVEDMFRNHMNLKNKNVLVIGSTRPWIEVMLLSEGVNHITTLDYYPYHCSHPNITTMSPVQLSNTFSTANYESSFDAMISFSSLEHGGLGR